MGCPITSKFEMVPNCNMRPGPRTPNERRLDMTGTPTRMGVRSTLDDWKWKEEHEAAMKCFDMEDWIESGCKVFDDLVAWHRETKRSIYRAEVDPVDAYRECFACYTRWLAIATDYVPTTDLAECEAQFKTVRGSDEFRKRIGIAQRTIGSWIDPSQVAALSARWWNLTEDEAADVDKIVEDSKHSPHQ